MDDGSNTFCTRCPCLGGETFHLLPCLCALQDQEEGAFSSLGGGGLFPIPDKDEDGERGIIIDGGESRRPRTNNNGESVEYYLA